jgi:hypothetical protein
VKRFTSRFIEAARQARHWSKNQSHLGGVKPLGARLLDRREATPSGRVA